MKRHVSAWDDVHNTTEHSDTHLYSLFHVSARSTSVPFASTCNGPCSTNKPNKEEPPGPPCSQISSGASGLPDCAGKYLRVHSPPVRTVRSQCAGRGSFTGAAATPAPTPTPAHLHIAHCTAHCVPEEQVVVRVLSHCEETRVRRERPNTLNAASLASNGGGKARKVKTLSARPLHSCAW